MMERQSDKQQKLFYTCLNLDKRIHKDYILRKVNFHLDFDFFYKHIENLYGAKGKTNRKNISTTNLDSTVVYAGADRSKLQYKVHSAFEYLFPVY